MCQVLQTGHPGTRPRSSQIESCAHYDIKAAFPDAPPGRQGNFADQVNQFVNTMAVGDIVVSPLKTLSKIGIDEISGPYQQLPNGYPARPAKWLTTDMPRDAFKQDLLYILGAIMTVCEVKRNDALRRVLAVAKTGKDPGDGASPDVQNKDHGEGGSDRAIYLEEMSRDQMERRISSVFTGHSFTNLIAEILRAPVMSCTYRRQDLTRLLTSSRAVVLSALRHRAPWSRSGRMMSLSNNPSEPNRMRARHSC